MNRRDLVITENHIKLLKRAWVSWYECEYGAPCIDPKRPYGNSDVEGDICDILGWSDVEESLNEAHRIHTQEMMSVTQIALNHPGEDIKGLWVDEQGYGIEWVRASWKDEKNLQIAKLKQQIKEMEAQADSHEFMMQGLRCDIEERLLPKLNEMLRS